jgi:hypothetical protein
VPGSPGAHFARAAGVGSGCTGIAVADSPVLLAKPIPWQAKVFLATLVLLTYQGIMAAAFWKGDATLQTSLASQVVPLLAMALGYFFGSSSGSEKKDDTIASNAAALANSTPNSVNTASIVGSLSNGSLARGTAPPVPPALI